MKPSPRAVNNPVSLAKISLSDKRVRVAMATSYETFNQKFKVALIQLHPKVGSIPF